MKHFLVQVWPAFAALLVGCAGMIWSVAAIKQEKDSSHIDISFPREVKSYAMMVDDSCIAKVNASGKKVPEGWALEIKGSIAGTKIEGSASFNSLRSMIGSTFYLKGTSIDLFIGSIGIVEMAVKISGSLYGRKIEYQTEIAGPITLSESADNFTLQIRREALSPMIEKMLFQGSLGVSMKADSSGVALNEVTGDYRCEEVLSPSAIEKIMKLPGLKWRLEH